MACHVKIFWNLKKNILDVSLPDYLRDPSRSFDSLHRNLKTSRFTSAHIALEALRLCDNYINLLLTLRYAVLQIGTVERMPED